MIDLAFRYGGDEFVILLAANFERKCALAWRAPAQADSRDRLAEGTGLNVQHHRERRRGLLSHRFPHQSRVAAPRRRGHVLVKNTTRDSVAAAGEETARKLGSRS